MFTIVRIWMLSMKMELGTIVFLPEGVFLEDLGQIVEEELIKAYNEVEREADEF